MTLMIIIIIIIDQWTGGTDDIEAEFDTIDENGGGQILFSEFVNWALSKVQ